ncbi:ABC transporter transmembrane region family protein, partial [Vibrio harveyi]
SLPSFAYF